MSSLKPGNESRAPAALPRYLRSGVRSTREALSYLRRHGVPEYRAQRLIAAYQGRGALDDRVAARLWAEHWARQGHAAAAVRLKLAAKGFADDLIDATIARYVPPADDEARARGLVSQHLARAADRRTRTRLARTLASRGFDPDVIERVLAESVGSADPDAD